MDRSQTLQEKAEIIETISGDLHVLLDSDAEEYFRFYKYAERFAEEKQNFRSIV